jgi:hypothetical protein
MPVGDGSVPPNGDPAAVLPIGDPGALPIEGPAALPIGDPGALPIEGAAGVLPIGVPAWERPKGDPPY